MNLRKKKELASRALNVGKNRVSFASSRLEEIKDAITKQDIRDLVESGAIKINPVSGRKKVERKSNRSQGNIRKIPDSRKKDYVMLTRKLRNYTAEMKNLGKIKESHIESLRKGIRNKQFKSQAHLKEHIGGIKNKK